MERTHADPWVVTARRTRSNEPVDVLAADVRLGAHEMSAIGGLLAALNKAEDHSPTREATTLDIYPYGLSPSRAKRLGHYRGLAVWSTIDDDVNTTLFIGAIVPLDRGMWEFVPAAVIPKVVRKAIIEQTQPDDG